MGGGGATAQRETARKRHGVAGSAGRRGLGKRSIPSARNRPECAEVAAVGCAVGRRSSLARGTCEPARDGIFRRARALGGWRPFRRAEKGVDSAQMPPWGGGAEGSTGPRARAVACRAWWTRLPDGRVGGGPPATRNGPPCAPPAALWGGPRFPPESVSHQPRPVPRVHLQRGVAPAAPLPGSPTSFQLLPLPRRQNVLRTSRPRVFPVPVPGMQRGSYPSGQPFVPKGRPSASDAGRLV